jgi:hypothetical protein
VDIAYVRFQYQAIPSRTFRRQFGNGQIFSLIGRRKFRWEDCVRDYLGRMKNQNLSKTDREAWKRTVVQATNQFEFQRQEKKKKKTAIYSEYSNT